jgi:hypothetical protein
MVAQLLAGGAENAAFFVLRNSAQQQHRVSAAAALPDLIGVALRPKQFRESDGTEFQHLQDRIAGRESRSELFCSGVLRGITQSRLFLLLHFGPAGLGGAASGLLSLFRRHRCKSSLPATPADLRKILFYVVHAAILTHLFGCLLSVFVSD